MIYRPIRPLRLMILGLLALYSIGASAQTITLNPTSLSGFFTCRYSASASQSFTVTVSGTAGNDPISVVAPPGYEVAISGGSYSGSVLLNADGSGNLASTTIDVRIQGDNLVISPSDVTVSSATVPSVTKTVSVSGSVSDPTIAYDFDYARFAPQGLSYTLAPADLQNSTAHPSTPWVSSDASVVSVTSGGTITGNALGTANITYMDNNGCTDVLGIEVIPRFTTLGYWDDATKWSSQQVPSNFSNVYMDALCTMDNETVIIDNMLFGNSGGIIVDNGSVLTISDTLDFKAANFYVHDSYFHMDANGFIRAGQSGSDASVCNIRFINSKPDHSRFTFWSIPFSMETINYPFWQSNLSDAYYWDYTASDGGVYNGQWAALQTRSNPASYGVYAGEGFIITPDQQAPGSSADVTESINYQFSNQTPNNGPISLALSAAANDWVLVGNPYTSPLDLTAFFGDNSDLTGSAYFWDDNSETYSGNYAVYVESGTSTSAYSSGNVPNGAVEPGQGFFVRMGPSATTIAISFDNDMRTLTAPAQFYKQEQRERLWLSLSNEAEGYQQIAVSLDEDATTAFDRGYDAHFLDGHTPLSLYSLAGSEQLVIQSLPKLAVQSELIPLGVSVAAAGVFILSIDSLDHWPASREVILVDSLMGTETDLRTTDYAFSTQWAGPIESRFFLRLVDATFNLTEAAEPSLRWAQQGNQLVLWCSSAGFSAIERVTATDVQGRKIMNRRFSEEEEIRFDVSNWTPGSYTLQVTHRNGPNTALQVVINGAR